MGGRRITTGISKCAPAALLALHAILFLDIAWRNFVTVDEAAHVAAGVYHWQTGDLTLYRVNPQLPRMLGVVPVLILFPEARAPAVVDTPTRRLEFFEAVQFANHLGPRYHEAVFASRLAGLGWSLLAGIVIFCWANELYKPPAGLLALALWCLGPNILAHATLLSPDVPAAAGGLVATYVFVRYLRKPTWQGAALAGLLLGGAMLTKFSALVLYPLWLALWLLHRVSGQRQNMFDLGTSACHALLICSLSVLVINCGYGFRGTLRPLGDFPFISGTFAGVYSGPGVPPPQLPANRFRGTWVGAVPVPVPEDFLRGIDVQRQDFESGRIRSYLQGEWRFPGWWYWHAFALGFKVPVGVLGLLLVGAVVTLWRAGGQVRWRDRLMVWIPAVAFFAAVSSQTGFTVHTRYLLPAFPFAIIALGEWGSVFRNGPRIGKVFVVGALGWAAVSGLAIHPHQLSYFNELAGGSERGPESLIDSNIDWGQDLLFLKRWADDHPDARPLGVAYFNLVDARVGGVEFDLPPFSPTWINRDAEEDLRRQGPRPGYYAISVNYLYGHGLVRTHDKSGQRVIVPKDGLGYFRELRPIGRAGYSILIYYISPESAAQLRRRLGLPP